MKFTCTQENLIKSLNIVSKISGKNVSLPILNNILVVVDNEGVNLSATNLEIGITTKMRSKTEEYGKITVPARILSSFVNYLPEEKVSFEMVGNEIKITSGSWKTKIKTQPAEDYPLIPEVDQKESFSLKANEFKKALSQTVFAAVNNESRPELSGGYFKISSENSELILVATDSYRLAEKKVKLSKDVKKEFNFIVPIKTLQELMRILSEVSDDIEVNVFYEENQIKFVLDGIELTSRLIDGEYPDYKQIIPSNLQTKVVFSKNEIVNAIKAAGLFAKTGVYDVLFSFKSPDKIIVKSTNSQVGENEAQIAAEINGNDCEIVFNYHYVLEGLLNIPQDKIQIDLTSSENPAILKSAGSEDYLYLIMPIRQ